MIMNLPVMTIFWKNLNKLSDMHEVGSAPHLAIDIFQFPKTGWKNLHSSPKALAAGDRVADASIPRSVF